MGRKSYVNAAWQRLQNPFSNWRVSILPGLTLTGLVIGVRLLGLFQSVELKTLDLFLRLRPAEPTDERVLIVAINEADIQNIGTYPIPDETLAALLKQLDQYQPRAVGIDIFRDLPVEPGHQIFVETLAALPYVFGVEFLETEIAPPPSLPDERVGFVDFLLDQDGLVRRSLLGRPDASGEYRFSLTIRVVEEYLRHEQISLDNGIRDPSAMRFGETELTPFSSNTGGYVRTDANAQQILLNFRSGSEPFRVVSLKEVLKGTVEPSWIQNSVILIGITSLSQKDIVGSAALAGRNPGQVYGVEMQAHAVSQILSAVMEDRSLLRALPDAGEYLWILVCGAAGIFLVGFVSTPSRHLFLILGSGLGLVAIVYAVLMGGWWIPVVPPLVAFLLNGLVLPGFLLYDQILRSRIEEGQRVIRYTYDAMHNGPLQTLALVLRDVDDNNQDVSGTQVAPRLHKLNQEIRSLYDTLEQELEPQNNQLHLDSGGPILELEIPLHELLYQVYAQTLERDFPNFQSIRVQIVKFEPMQADDLSMDEKRYLCRFLEEVLCNVGRYADGVTRLKVTCLSTEYENLIMVEDNGKCSQNQYGFNVDKPEGGRGTRQAKQLAKYLKGQFRRFTVSPHGTCCELRWPIYQPRHWWLW
ncbi:MAG: CHASE2 domain-containing protein [Cyanobacteria bacterium P01_A01_bin.123]